MNIDIIIPVYKNASLTKRCIDSILSNLHEIKQLSPRLLVINDSPDDLEVKSMLDDLTLASPEVLIFTNAANRGFVKSVNSGLEISKRDGRDVILVNADTETFADTLYELVEVAYSDPMIGFVSPRSNNASLCSLPHFFGGTIPSPELAHRRWKEISSTLPRFHFTPTAIGFYLYIKHVILADFGLLREEFGVGYEEENDLILRANKVGYRAALANRSFAFHAGSASFNLLDIDLQNHRNGNLERMNESNPEFMPLVQRYEASPHFRAERLLNGLVNAATDKIKLAIDLSGLACYHNGTNEFALAVVKSLGQRHGEVFDVSVICSLEAFKFHGLNRMEHVSRKDPSNPGLHTIAIKLGQPFDQPSINIMENLAPINIYGMLDTIAEDCGHLSITYRLSDYWQYVARHANGLIFISEFSENSFFTRYPDAQVQPKYTSLLPTRLTAYKASSSKCVTKHILILGNHFPHKASDTTAVELSRYFPTLQFVVLGAETFDRGNLRGFRAGTLDSETVASLFSEANIVILPSYIEGFGFGLLHALASGKVVVARNIPATVEILNTYKTIKGVYLYNNNTEIQQAVISAMKEANSFVDDSSAIGWDEWVDGMADFCMKLLRAPDLFARLCNRIESGNSLRSATSNIPSISITAAENLASLMKHEGRQFVDCAYLTMLKRKPDQDGLNQRLSQLQRGVPKIQILLGMQRSAEGRMTGVKLKGLRRAFIRYKLKKYFIS